VRATAQLFDKNVKKIKIAILVTFANISNQKISFQSYAIFVTLVGTVPCCGLFGRYKKDMAFGGLILLIACPLAKPCETRRVHRANPAEGSTHNGAG